MSVVVVWWGPATAYREKVVVGFEAYTRTRGRRALPNSFLYFDKKQNDDECGNCSHAAR